MSLYTLANLIRTTYGWRLRPTDVKAAYTREDGTIYFRLLDGRNGTVQA